MNLSTLLTAISALIATTLAYDYCEGLTNWCGHFKHGNESGQLGCLYAHDQCENFESSYPDDARVDWYKSLPVFLIENMHCGLCFVWEYAVALLK